MPKSRKSTSYIPAVNFMAYSKAQRNTITPKDKMKITFKADYFEEENNSRSNSFKSKDRGKELVETFEASIKEYVTKFNKSYIEHIFSSLSLNLIELTHEYYNKKVKVYESYEEQIQELKMMLESSENSEANTTINLMLNHLFVERSKEEMDLKLEFDNNYYTIFQNIEPFDKQQSMKIYTDGLLLKFTDKINKIASENMKA